MEKYVRININAKELTSSGLLPGHWNKYSGHSVAQLIFVMGQESLSLPAKIMAVVEVDDSGESFIKASRESVTNLMRARGLASSNNVNDLMSFEMTEDQFIEISLRGTKDLDLSVSDLRSLYGYMRTNGSVPTNDDHGISDALGVVSGAVLRYTSANQVVYALGLTDHLFNSMKLTEALIHGGEIDMVIPTSEVTALRVNEILDNNGVEYIYRESDNVWLVIA